MRIQFKNIIPTLQGLNQLINLNYSQEKPIPDKIKGNVAYLQDEAQSIQKLEQGVRDEFSDEEVEITLTKLGNEDLPSITPSNLMKLIKPILHEDVEIPNTNVMNLVSKKDNK